MLMQMQMQMKRPCKFRCGAQLLSCRWRDAETLQVRLIHPPPPEILTLEQGDILRGENSRIVRVAVFLPTTGRLVRGGVVKTEYISG
jgi:hypothetical protein